MNERRANPYGSPDPSGSIFVDYLFVIVAIGVSASVGTLIGGIIYRAFIA